MYRVILNIQALASMFKYICSSELYEGFKNAVKLAKDRYLSANSSIDLIQTLPNLAGRLPTDSAGWHLWCYTRSV